jgi:putative component of membrane protein insertase Oxa1/YidC/SpoIIIJ protein YidD
MINVAAIRAINCYQRHISPDKGFQCAYITFSLIGRYSLFIRFKGVILSSHECDTITRNLFKKS